MDLRRYGRIARLLMKYGRSDLVQQAGLERLLVEEGVPAGGAARHRAVSSGEYATATSESFAADLEAMGPTYIKLGQLLSTRSDFLPPEYMASLARLQDNVEPFPYAQVEEIVTTELGVRFSRAFREFEPEPIAAASLGQVHRAVLRSGRVVAVKVQRPGIREAIAGDLAALEDIAEFLGNHTDVGRRYDLKGMLEEFRRSLIRELDYTREANHLTIIGRNLREFDDIVVPAPVPDYSTARLLTMDYVRGRKVTALAPLALLELDGESLAESLFKAYMKQILVDGIFHADPHPGNVFLTDDRQLALIDLGMIGRIAPVMQENLLKLLLALSEGNGEAAAGVAIEMGEPLADFDENRYLREVSQLVAEHQHATIGELKTGRVMLELTHTAGASGLRLPADLALLGKTMLNLDLVAQTLAPNFQPNEIIRRNASEVLRRRLTRSLAPGNLLPTLLELNEFAHTFPARVNRVLDRVAENELSLKVDAFDQVRLMEGMQKIANRITLGLVLAALILGAAMLMRVETSFRIFGYPGLAMLLFLAAACGGAALAYSILFRDEHG